MKTASLWLWYDYLECSVYVYLRAEESNLVMRPRYLKFGYANWSHPQSVSVSLVDDVIDQGASHADLINTTVVQGDKFRFCGVHCVDFIGVAVRPIPVLIFDDDTAGILIDKLVLEPTVDACRDERDIVASRGTWP